MKAASLVPALGALLLLAACSGDGDRPEVVLVGDSIAEETSSYLGDRLGDGELRAAVFGGTAPCDWLDEGLDVTSDQIAVVSFTGNSLTPCMSDGSGGHLRGQALVDKYRADLAALLEVFTSQGARVLVVGQPQRGPRAGGGGEGDLEVAGINATYDALADIQGVSFVDAGAAVETADGAFAATLPCLPEEPGCGPDGTAAVRNDDGVHLCPGPPELACPAYASGAFRFADAIADAIAELRAQG